jgi:hypothetical protein
MECLRSDGRWMGAVRIARFLACHWQVEYAHQVRIFIVGVKFAFIAFVQCIQGADRMACARLFAGFASVVCSTRGRERVVALHRAWHSGEQVFA